MKKNALHFAQVLVAVVFVAFGHPYVGVLIALVRIEIN